MRRLTYLVAVSIDGYIAGPSDEVDFFPSSDAYAAWMLEEYPDVLPSLGRTQVGLTDAPNRHFDTVVMGRRTYEPGLALGMASPYPHLRQYVVSSTQEELSADVTIVRDDPLALVRGLKAEDAPLDVYLAGGSRLAATVLPEIDRIVVKRYPVVAGAGISAFGGAPFAPVSFDLTDLTTFPGGNAVLVYDRI
ncbi:dihydrofolate reductase [Mumia zhuanghuii]|uniref:Dihydrofolate reductase family protein n=2 Tax=Mumia TaxID=1546255 RepID=A0ABW1QLZ2_9ACTN|nr:MULTISPECIES: dihydrofolate reductase [Mumia]KAA1419808.1 dihydrofolate reductase [Mumia zhuanghuii]